MLIPAVKGQGARKSKTCFAASRADAGDAIRHSFLGLGKDGLPPPVPGAIVRPRAASEGLALTPFLTIESDPMQSDDFLGGP